MIIFFTGTGNSRYIADVMANKLGDVLLDAAEMIKEGKYPELFSEKPYIIISPVYAWRLPRVFSEWLSKCKFSGNKKMYFVINCGSEIGAAGNYIQRFCRKTEMTYMGTAELVMPENYIIMFTSPKKEQIPDIIKKATEKTLGLAEKVSDEVPFDNVKVTLLGHIYSDVVNPCFYTFYIGAKKFYATEKCVSCGKCADVCMLNNITLEKGLPQWGIDCTHCMACISQCPTEAIEYGRNTKGKTRYVCPKYEREE